MSSPHAVKNLGQKSKFSYRLQIQFSSVTQSCPTLGCRLGTVKIKTRCDQACSLCSFFFVFRNEKKNSFLFFSFSLQHYHCNIYSTVLSIYLSPLYFTYVSVYKICEEGTMSIVSFFSNFNLLFSIVPGASKFQ